VAALCIRYLTDTVHGLESLRRLSCRLTSHQHSEVTTQLRGSSDGAQRGVRDGSGAVLRDAESAGLQTEKW
jgi:hypothetical protein